jgi:ABC-type phosphate transport system permease subunit
MLYAAMPGIVTGILLGIGVALGETLVLLFTYTGPSVSTFPAQWWRIFNFHQQLPSLTVFI